MFLVGLTGGIASGKSVASKFFHEHGVRVIDSDSIAREVVQPGTSTYRRLRNEFGPEFFDETSGQLRREKLGDLIFYDAEQRRRLNAIVHPAIRRQIVLQTLGSLLTFERFVVVDIPLLFESKLEGFFQKIVVVHCTEENQVQRLCRRDGISEEQARARIAAQLPAAYKIERATFALDNNGTFFHSIALC
ncbi:Dephospho-CoA kinase [Aphelenchoides fujianensis]|nr:Dephospho-CoA kinase [Aphelenchoides fujianensis]